MFVNFFKKQPFRVEKICPRSVYVLVTSATNNGFKKVFKGNATDFEQKYCSLNNFELHVFGHDPQQG